MNLLLALALFAQADNADVRGVSWWLDAGARALGINREVFWTLVLSLNLLALLWILYKALFQGKDWSIPSALRHRGADIQTQMREAERVYQEATARLAQVEARLAALPAELAALETSAAAEAEAEFQRLAAETRHEADRIALSARQEIEAASKFAQKELQGFAAKLALDLAEKRIRERLTPELDRLVVHHAVQELEN